MGAVDRAKSGLAKIGGAAALVEIGRQLWPVVKPAVDRGRQNAAAWRTARAHADRVRDGSYLDVFVTAPSTGWCGRATSRWRLIRRSLATWPGP